MILCGILLFQMTSCALARGFVNIDDRCGCRDTHHGRFILAVGMFIIYH